jgi:uncharacterized membrane protein YccC
VRYWLVTLPGLIWAESRELTLTGPRARLALAAAVSVGVAILLALLLRLEAVFWAGISAFICIQANQPRSVQKGAHRILGTLLGAGAAYLIFPSIAFNHAATMLLLFCAGFLALLGFMLSRYSYAWLLGGITTVMIVLGALDDPTQTLNLAVYRAAEIILGTTVALATARLLLPPAVHEASTAPGWGSLLGDHWYVLGHAIRAGIFIALVPVVWRVFELPALSQMAVSVGVVMAVPVLTGKPAVDHRAVNERAAQRLYGCLAGGGAGLLLLLTPLPDYFLAWLLLLMAGAALAAQVESGRHGLPMFGIQAELALILTLVQGWGAPLSLAPALDRMAGILCAIILLLVLSLIFDPVVESAPAAR